MVGQRDQTLNVKAIFDLAPFEVVGLARRQRRSPKSSRELEGASRGGLEALLLPANHFAEYRNGCRISRNEGEAFLGVQCVAMQRNAGAKLSGRCAVTPKH